MEGSVITNLRDAIANPHELGDFIAAPSHWTVQDKASLVKPGPLASTVVVATLSSLCDYARENRDALDVATISAHVVSPTEVRLFGALDARARQREVFVTAKTVNLMDGFLDKFMSIEDFVLGMQVRFENAGDRAKVIGLLGTVKSEVVKTSHDDGMTQVVEARAGAVLKTEAAVPNPVTLRPFRTFREVEQPESSFVLRVKQTESLPMVGLFEADGGAWKLAATERVMRWLRTNAPETVAVLG